MSPRPCPRGILFYATGAKAGESRKNLGHGSKVSASARSGQNRKGAGHEAAISPVGVRFGKAFGVGMGGVGFGQKAVGKAGAVGWGCGREGRRSRGDIADQAAAHQVRDPR